MKLFLLITAMLCSMCPARALILWNLDNSANQTDPASGVPFNSVAAVTNSTGTLRSGSAVYIGDGFLLTANHVTMDATYSSVTFNGIDFFEIDPTFQAGVRYAGKQITTSNPGEILDLAVFKLASIPTGIDAVTMLGSPSELVAPATLVGWGVGRAPLEPLLDPLVTWGNSTTSAKRWGESTIRAAISISYDGYSFNSLSTVAGGTGPGFSPEGLGDSEASPTLLDSGSGLFQQIGGTWLLVGITAAVERQAGGSTTTFGNDAVSGTGRGDRAFYVRISDYDSDILAMIPEPGSASLLVLALACFLFLRGKRRQTASRSLLQL